MHFDTLLYDLHNHVATVTLNRPKVLNALNAEVLDELEELFAQITENSSVRVVLITGSGDRAFAAGADINELAQAGKAPNSPTGEQLALRGQTVFALIETCGKPVIALINGFALGGGCELALACTMRLAADTAKLGQPEIKLGIMPGYGGTQRLPRLIGQSRALRLILTGDTGRSVTFCTGAMSTAGSSDIRNRCASVARIRRVSIIAKLLPIHMRGPPPNGRYA